MESFDQSLKYLLHKEPMDFIRFGLEDMTVELVGPIPSNLPSRGRDVDGGYRIRRGEDELVAHVEFHRRHQKLDELQVDVAEAQVRLYRRERVPVLSQVWDLYGAQGGPLLKEQALAFGAKALNMASQAVYVRVNLRALRAAELLSSAPPALWPLVALTRDGAEEGAVRQACAAIEARVELGPAERADHLAVLWFVAEAEDVPVQAMKVYLTKERLMESVLYKEIFEEGEVRGRAQALAGMLVRGLIRHLGTLDPAVRERIRSEKDSETLDVWCDELLGVRDADEARQLVNKIMNATGR